MRIGGQVELQDSHTQETLIDNTIYYPLGWSGQLKTGLGQGLLSCAFDVTDQFDVALLCPKIGLSVVLGI
jgi:hypothetical protein